MDQLPEITPFQRRLDELDAQMADPSFYTNPRKAADISREQQGLRQLVDQFTVYERMGQDLAAHTALIKDPKGDPELRALAQMEVPELEQKRAALKQAVLLAMI